MLVDLILTFQQFSERSSIMEFELPLISFLLLPFLLSCSGRSAYGEFIDATVSTSVVKYLPGFEGTLPFYLETGYVQIGSGL